MDNSPKQRGIIIIGAGNVEVKTAIAIAKAFPDKKIVVIDDIDTYKISASKTLPPILEIHEVESIRTINYNPTRRERRKQQRKRR